MCVYMHEHNCYIMHKWRLNETIYDNQLRWSVEKGIIDMREYTTINFDGMRRDYAALMGFGNNACYVY